MNCSAADRVLYDFQAASGSAEWQVVNDEVMGGTSRSQFTVANGVAVFSGVVSLENNGGFASVRSVPTRRDLTGCDAFQLRVRGDGRRYKFTARTAGSFDAPLYQAVFATKAGEWEEHRLSMPEFVPTFRGRVLYGEPPLELANVISVGFLISEKQAGPFRIEIAWIRAVRSDRGDVQP
jgi:hypothetical protein